MKRKADDVWDRGIVHHQDNESPAAAENVEDNPNNNNAPVADFAAAQAFGSGMVEANQVDSMEDVSAVGGCWNPPSFSDASSYSCFGIGSSAASSSSSSHPASSSSPAETLLVQEMNALTVQERQLVYEDVHGVRDPLVETEEMVVSSLQEMQTAMQAIKKKAAYDKAQLLAPSRLVDRTFLLQFLRAEDFDGPAAARRLVAFFEFGWEYFGWAALVRPIRQSDMTAEELDFLRLGSVQPLPTTYDRSGRPICTFFVSRGPYKEYSHVMRACFYIYMHMLQNVHAQQLGVVLICYETGARGTWNPSFALADIRASTRFYQAVPVKIAAIHYCYNDAKIMPVIEFVKLIVGRQGRIRFRTHFASDTEARYRLMGFGIDPNQLPVDPTTGIMNPSSFHAWLEDLQRHEESKELPIDTTPGSQVSIPSLKDVLLGKGVFYSKWPGNQRLAQVVQDNWEVYQSKSTPSKKYDFFLHILGSKFADTRFLKRTHKEDLHWTVVSLDRAREKISASFRNKPVLEKYHASRKNSLSTTSGGGSLPS